MATTSEPVEVRMAPEAAKLFREATEEERRKYELLLSLRLLDVARRDETLEDVVAEISRDSKARGLTPQILDEILRES